MSKVRLDVLRPWISKKITEILNIEDDVVVEFVYNQLEEKNVSMKAEQWSLEFLFDSLTINLFRTHDQMHRCSFRVQRKCK